MAVKRSVKAKCHGHRQTLQTTGMGRGGGTRGKRDLPAYLNSGSGHKKRIGSPRSWMPPP